MQKLCQTHWHCSNKHQMLILSPCLFAFCWCLAVPLIAVDTGHSMIPQSSLWWRWTASLQSMRAETVSYSSCTAALAMVMRLWDLLASHCKICCTTFTWVSLLPSRPLASMLRHVITRTSLHHQHELCMQPNHTSCAMHVSGHITGLTMPQEPCRFHSLQRSQLRASILQPVMLAWSCGILTAHNSKHVLAAGSGQA